MFVQREAEMFHTRTAHNISIAIILLLSGSGARAQFTYTAQTRSVSGSLSGGGSASQTITAPDFALFDATTNLTLPTTGGSADQHQRSELLAHAITVLGDVSIFRPTFAGTGLANTRSLTDVFFDLATTTDVTLFASGTAFSSGIPTHDIKLTGPSTNIDWNAFNSGALFPQGSLPRSTNLTLGPGTYRFIVDMHSFNTSIIPNSHSVPNFNVSLAVVPEPTFTGLLMTLLPLALKRRRRVM
jgi:hypothetical protein